MRKMLSKIHSLIFGSTLSSNLGSNAMSEKRELSFADTVIWKLSEPDYPQIKLTENHVIGISAWVEKILELAPNYDQPWNVLLADLWPNDKRSRLIGHVQMKDQAIGHDTGFRVCAYLENAGIEGDTGDDIPLVTEWLGKAVLEQSTQKKLRILSKSKPFEIRLTCWGGGNVGEGIEIKF